MSHIERANRKETRLEVPDLVKALGCNYLHENRGKLGEEHAKEERDVKPEIRTT